MRDLNARANSNESLRIIAGGDDLRVLKTYTVDLSRAVQSIEKQTMFTCFKNSSMLVEAAPILSMRKLPTCIEVQMPYIEGYSGEDFAIYGTKSVSKNLSSVLTGIIERELKSSVETEVKKKIFANKLEEVFDLTQELQIKTFYPRFKKILNQLPEVFLMPIGQCHGDLTLGNLIYGVDAKITLIDFLHTYLESPLQDVTKLTQEFKYFWSFRKSPEPLKTKGQIFLSTAYPKVLDEISKRYFHQIAVFELLNLVRIAPYIRDEATCRWLMFSMQKFLNDYKK